MSRDVVSDEMSAVIGPLFPAVKATGRPLVGRRPAADPTRPSDDQRQRYKGRTVVERCFNKLKQWRGIAMRTDKTARNYHAGLCLAATLHWITSTKLSNTS